MDSVIPFILVTVVVIAARWIRERLRVLHRLYLSSTRRYGCWCPYSSLSSKEALSIMVRLATATSMCKLLRRVRIFSVSALLEDTGSPLPAPAATHAAPKEGAHAVQRSCAVQG